MGEEQKTENKNETQSVTEKKRWRAGRWNGPQSISLALQ